MARRSPSARREAINARMHTVMMFPRPMRPTVSKSGRVNSRAEWATEMPVRRVVMYSPSIRALRMPVSDS